MCSRASSMPRSVPVSTYEHVPIVPPTSTGCPVNCGGAGAVEDLVEAVEAAGRWRRWRDEGGESWKEAVLETREEMETEGHGR